MKHKKCAICREPFEPRTTTQKACSWQCAVAYTAKKKAILQAKQKREGLEKLKSVTDYLNEAQTAFNSWIRYRDKDKPCISCQRYHEGQIHAGHFRTVKSASQLRYNHDNVHAQCSVCNNHLSGNVLEYRINLVKLIGKERVEALENNNEFKRWTKEEAKAIKQKYTLLLKELKSKDE
jgi:hypothetical protein